MHPRKLEILVAGDRIEALSTEVRHVLSDCGFIERKSVSCVGFCRAPDGALLVVLPKAFANGTTRSRLSADNVFRMEEVFRLVRVFRKILYDTKFSQDYIDSSYVSISTEKAVDPVLEAVEAAIRLRADFRQNGLWLPKKQQRVANAPGHPVSWPATLARCTPLLNENEILFYNTIHDKRAKDPSDLFYRLHLHILKEIFALTAEGSEILDSSSDEDGSLVAALRNPATLLRGLRRRIFTDRGRKLLGYIEAYLGLRTLLASSRHLRDYTLSYTAAFENVWELILAGLFTPEAKPNFALPEGKWAPWPPSSLRTGFSPRADLVLEKPNAVILDAKDYRVINGSPLIGAPADHYKQIIYRILFQSKDSKPIVNILAFPSIDQRQLFQLKGCHFWENMTHSRVFEVFVDYDMAVKHWLGERRTEVDAAFKTLLSEIATLESKMPPSSTAALKA